jgi:hypothetical protein
MATFGGGLAGATWTSSDVPKASSFTAVSISPPQSSSHTSSGDRSWIMSAGPIPKSNAPTSMVSSSQTFVSNDQTSNVKTSTTKTHAQNYDFRSNNDKSEYDPIDVLDYTNIPTQLDSSFERHGKGNVIRPVIIHPGKSWSRNRQESLLSKSTKTILNEDNQKLEKNKAFDLLDALTKSGALTIDNTSLHIVMVASHCFDKSLLETLIQDNVNPISKIERTTLIMAKTIHTQLVEDMVKPDHLSRIRQHSPMLLQEEN